MGDDRTSEFERQVAGLLQRRADRLTVVADIGATTDRLPQRSATTRWWLGAVAALMIVGGVQIARPSGDDDIAADGPDRVAATAEFAAPASSPDEIIVWLRVGVRPDQVRAIALELGRSPEVDGYSYVDQDDTYLEFVEYFADEPEIIDLVERQQLPTSFRVLTDDPLAVGARLADLAGVDEVESAERADD